MYTALAMGEFLTIDAVITCSLWLLDLMMSLLSCGVSDVERAFEAS